LKRAALRKTTASANNVARRMEAPRAGRSPAPLGRLFIAWSSFTSGC
jgi:hypothetical protein